VIEAASGGPHRFFIAKGSGSRFEASEWNSVLPAAMLSLRRVAGHWSGLIMPPVRLASASSCHDTVDFPFGGAGTETRRMGNLPSNR
jgi:hypothetical protein